MAQIVYVSLATREYGEGRICLTTDKLSGYLTIHGQDGIGLWRNVLEWTGQRFSYENINIGVIRTSTVESLSYLNLFDQVSYTEINVDDLLGDISSFNLLYFVGLPDSLELTTPIRNVIELYVRSGGGVLIEAPFHPEENINVLTSIEDVYCSSIQVPSYTLSYWTTDGKAHYAYSENSFVGFYSTLENTSFSSNWTLLMTNIDNKIEKTFKVKYYETVSNCSSEFGIGYVNALKNGIITIETQ